MFSLVIISDIHGCAPALEKVLSQTASCSPDYYLLLGDILNHGPRNPVPQGYAPPQVAELLNSVREKIIAVRGNCDSEVDQMLLQFPCLAPHNQLLLDDRRWFMTHGHVYETNTLPLVTGDILLSGHTHLAGIEHDASGIYHINPGSITFPRNGAEASYAVYRQHELTIMGLETQQILARQHFPHNV
jgi:phosphoesterase, MJ0936 family